MYSEWKETVRIAFVGAGLLACADAYAGSLTLGIGADYGSGKYGEPNTTKDLSIPLSLAYKAGAWRAKLVLPYISIEGNGEVVGGPDDRLVDDRRGRNSGSGSSGSGDSDDDDDPASSAAAAGTSTRESGLGDISLSTSYSAVANESLGLYVDLTARVKFGTASVDKGLGSGENDYGLLVDVDKDFGALTLSVGTGYTFIGEPPGFDYRNVISASTGASYRISEAFSVNTYLSFRQSARRSAPNQLDISPGIGFRLSENQRVNAYVLFGLEDGSPDFGAGIGYTHSF